MTGKCNGKCVYVAWDQVLPEQLLGTDGKSAFDPDKDITADDAKCLKIRKKKNDKIKSELVEKIKKRMRNEAGFVSECPEDCEECKAQDFRNILKPAKDNDGKNVEPKPYGASIEWSETHTINGIDVECNYTAKGTLKYQKMEGFIHCTPKMYALMEQRITETITLISNEEQPPETLNKIRELVTKNQDNVFVVNQELELES